MSGRLTVDATTEWTFPTGASPATRIWDPGDGADRR